MSRSGMGPGGKEKLGNYSIPNALVTNSLLSGWGIDSKSNFIEVSFGQLQELYDSYLLLLSDCQTRYVAALAQSTVVEDSRLNSPITDTPTKIETEYKGILEKINKLIALYPQLAKDRK